MSSTNDLPDIASMKLSELKKELNLYGIDSSNFCEKQEFTSALDNARKTLPRPTTTYHEVEPPKPTDEEIQKQKEKERREKEKERASRASRKSSTGSSTTKRSSVNGSTSAPSSKPATSSTPPTSAPAPTPINNNNNNNNNNNTATNAAAEALAMKKLLASRSPLTALQQIKEHPSEKLIGERNHSFLPGSPFSFSLKGSLFESDAAILRIPDGVQLTLTSASVERKAMDEFLKQKGSIGVSLRISSEENPQLLPIWTFDKERSKSYSVTDMGVVVCGPRTVRLLAYMEMGFSSKMSVDVNVFGSVGLDRDKFD